MRIGILSNTYPPTLNGVSVAVKSLKEGLEKNGHQVFLATPEVKTEKYPDNILAIRSAPVPKSISPDLKLPYLYVNQAYNFFRQNKVEIIHTHDTVFGGLEGIIIATKLNLPCIHTFHTMIQDYDYFKFPGYKSFIKNFIQTVCNGYDHVIAPSQKVYQYLLSIGVSSPVSQILNVPDIKGLKTNFELNIFKQYQTKTKISPENDFVFITFCRLAKEKGVKEGIEVLVPVLKKNANVKYLILGDGPEKEGLEKFVSDLGLTKQVIFAGKYKREELVYYTKLSKVFLFTSTTDNLPTNIFEAMFYGLPVVSVNDSSVDYLLQNNKNGIKTELSELTKICAELISNKQKLIDMSKFAKASSLDINPDEVANEHIALYRRNIERFFEKNKYKDNSLYKVLDKKVLQITNKILQKPLKTFDKFNSKSLQSLREVYSNFIQKYF